MREDPVIRVTSRAQLRANADGEMSASLVSQKAASHLKGQRGQRRRKLRGWGVGNTQIQEGEKEEIATEKW